MADTAFPVIDLTPFRTGDESAKRKVARLIDQTCREIGFLGVVGHGIDEARIQACYDSARAFFDRPMAEKMAIRQPAANIVRGYIPLGGGALAATEGEETPPDLKESLTIGALQPYPSAPGALATLRSPNLWPEKPAALRPAWQAYYRDLEELGRTLMRAFALALDLEEDYFLCRMDRHFSILSAIHYPDQAEEPRPGQLRAGVHSDFGTLTILRPDDAPGGLQVLDKTGKWADAPRLPGGFIINIGDLMARWTNDRWVSTLHRVVNPPRDKALGSRRISLAYFQEINPDIEVTALPTCVDAEHPARFAPVTAGAHHIDKFSRQAAAAAKAQAQS
ncbi:MAG: 2-oxoglutarate and iron-dependent oxygenase domain-containing protein [Alphaproteobacteria bacterium]